MNKRPDATSAERNRRKRLKKKEQGLVKVEVYVPMDKKQFIIACAKELHRMKARRDALQEIINEYYPLLGASINES